jgi:hypothetical protein
MAQTLELVDLTGEQPEPTGATATLDDTGRVTYEGDGVKAIIGKFLVGHSPTDVFEKMADWSNGYVMLRTREA